jgi:FtsP/CotA-like multicopper oxidase with cupredoxin domain
VSFINTNNCRARAAFLPAAVFTAASMLAVAAHAASPGVTGPSVGGPTFDLRAESAFITQPDGQMVYSWGYGCNSAPSGFAGVKTGASCGTMQIPGPTLIVTEGDTVTVKLSNGLPASAGNTSILFPGFQVTTSGGAATPGLLTQEAAPGGSVTYTFTASSPGTHAYYSGTQGDLQIEMGLYGAVIVLPAPAKIPANCTATGTLAAKNLLAEAAHGESDYRLAAAAYDHPGTCYDREYLFQFSEMDPVIHRQAEEQVAAATACALANSTAAPANVVVCPALNVVTEPYHPAYFMINGRSMPDDMDPNYASQYPHQPYNGNPHMHPGELVLLRVIGTGRWQHPFHEHGNHVRVLGRDGNLILSSSAKPASPTLNDLAGPLLFTTTTTPGLTLDGIFYWTGRGLNWDVFGHHTESGTPTTATAACTPDVDGYNTGDPTAINYYEWCGDHNKPLEAHPFGNVGGGGPVTLPDANILTNGAWFGGSPYLGPDATTRAVGPNGTTPPSGTVANPPGSEAGFAFMWHSHNEREITTNNIFPGGMMMMMLVDSREFLIDESK